MTEKDIILEANFHEHELLELHRAAREGEYNVLTLVLRGDADILYQRCMNRMNYENRHPVHLSTTIDRKDDFPRCAELIRSEEAAGRSIVVDAGSFAYQTDGTLLEEIDRFMLEQDGKGGGA